MNRHLVSRRDKPSIWREPDICGKDHDGMRTFWFIVGFLLGIGVMYFNAGGK